jgi:carboxyl-terminal processing protease
MRRTLPLLIAVTAAALTFGFVSTGDNAVYERIGRAMETFGAVYREIITNYVDEVDADSIARIGVDAMLDHLDPYSEYYVDGESEDVDQLTNGYYVGFGFTSGTVDSQLTILELREGQPAPLAGLRVGDRIIRIGNVDVSRLAARQLRPLTRGPVGSVSTFTVVRDGRPDTIVVDIARAQIPVKTVTATELLPDNIGYIKLARFSRRAPDDVRLALDDFRRATYARQARLNGVILDLRGNPGGLLEAAVRTAQLFVPRGSVIVTTAGRGKSESREYRAEHDPLEPDLPLTILVDENSASASEVLAGAIQDLDRGVVLGQQSFGKGLVQTMVQLPNNAELKLTTSRYYTPSGRSIQRLQAGGRSSAQTQTTFYTTHRRSVASSNGIIPDIRVAPVTEEEPLATMLKHQVLFRFATRYCAPMASVPSGLTADKAVIAAFLKYAQSVPPSHRSGVLAALDSARIRLTSGPTPDPALLRSIEIAIKTAERDAAQKLTTQLPLVKKELEREFTARRTGERKQMTADDPVISAARTVLTSGKYASVLASPEN